MSFGIGDRVQLPAELGGATGYVTAQQGGPQAEGTIMVSQPWGQSDIDDGMTLPPSLLAAGPLPLPRTFAVGDQVSVAGEAGTIVDIANDVAAVEVLVELTRRRWARLGRPVPKGRVEYTRTHRVPLWRLCMEN
jgi:hypothetical protein